MQPQNRPRGGSVELSRSEVRRIADALEPIIQRFPNRTLAAKSIGISDGTIARFTRRPASLSISRTVVDDVCKATGIDASKLGA